MSAHSMKRVERWLIGVAIVWIPISLMMYLFGVQLTGNALYNNFLKSANRICLVSLVALGAIGLRKWKERHLLSYCLTELLAGVLFTYFSIVRVMAQSSASFFDKFASLFVGMYLIKRGFDSLSG